jgi:hypothetical protein
MNRKCLFVPVLLLAGIAVGAEKSHTYRSPDGALIAIIIKVNKSSEAVVEIRAPDGKLLFKKDYSSSDAEHGQGVCFAAWTPDSRFFVYSMENSGGHQPWARHTEFYSQDRREVFSLDRLTYPITECEFKLQSPDWIITKRLDATTGRYDIPLRVSLSKLTLASGR